MASLVDIRQGLYTNLNTAFSAAYQVSPYVLSAPAAKTIWVDVGHPTVSFHAAMGDGAEWWNMIVQGFVSNIIDRSAQANADALFDQMRASLEADPTLTGAVDDLIVDTADFRTWEHPSLQQPLVGVECKVRILASKTVS